MCEIPLISGQRVTGSNENSYAKERVTQSTPITLHQKNNRNSRWYRHALRTGIILGRYLNYDDAEVSNQLIKPYNINLNSTTEMKRI